MHQLCAPLSRCHFLANACVQAYLNRRRWEFNVPTDGYQFLPVRWSELGCLRPSRRQQQRRDRHAQRRSQTLDVVERDVSGQPFDMCHECSMQGRLERQCFLAPSSFVAKADDVPGDDLALSCPEGQRRFPRRKRVRCCRVAGCRASVQTGGRRDAISRDLQPVPFSARKTSVMEARKSCTG